MDFPVDPLTLVVLMALVMVPILTILTINLLWVVILIQETGFSMLSSTSQIVSELFDKTKHLNPRKLKSRNLTLDRSNPWKLWDFLVLCNLHFHDCPQVFADEKKILSILSYLKELALSWFKPGLNNPTDSAHWTWNYFVFPSELEGNFSPMTCLEMQKNPSQSSQ